MKSPLRVERRHMPVALALSIFAVTVLGRPIDVGAQRSALSAVRAQVAPEVHTPPVEARVIDPFRPPEHAFGPGNLGLEYDTAPGQIVSASAGGVVSFSGQVGGTLFVTVDHGGGLRTTVGMLAQVDVSSGESVGRGDRLGIAGDNTHFSARQDGEHFDPELLFGSVEIVVRLVSGPG